MRNHLSIFLICLFLAACSKNNSVNNCNFLLNTGVNYNLNLNLPQFSDLQFPSNSVYVPNQGNGGIIITNNGTGIVAWDASDPNHAPSACSIMSITGGINATCNCGDGNEYSLITGQSVNEPLSCTLKIYRVEQTGNNTYFISN